MIKFSTNIQSLFASSNVTTELELLRILAHTELQDVLFAVDLHQETNTVDFILNVESEEQIPHTTIDSLISTNMEQSLAALKVQIHNDINTYRDNTQYNYFIHDGSRWDCRPETRAMITGAVALALANGGNLPPEFIFRDFDNINHPFTGLQMIQLGSALFAFTGQCYQASWIHKYCVGILTTASEVNSYDYTVSWPVVN